MSMAGALLLTHSGLEHTRQGGVAAGAGCILLVQPAFAPAVLKCRHIWCHVRGRRKGASAVGRGAVPGIPFFWGPLHAAPVHAFDDLQLSGRIVLPVEWLGCERRLLALPFVYTSKGVQGVCTCRGVRCNRWCVGVEE